MGPDFNNTRLFDNNLNETNSTLSMYVNGVKVPTNTDFRNVNINARDEIALIFGQIPKPIKYLRDINFNKGYDLCIPWIR